MLRAQSWMPFVALLLLGASPGCNCDCASEIEIGLPTPNASTSQSLRVQLRPGEAPEAQMVCTWDAATSTAGTVAWSCTPAAHESHVDIGTPFFSHFSYESADVNAAWSIELEGPTGSQVLTRTPRDTDPGEGYPGSCVCYPYTLTVTADELRAVGAVLP
ncbi:MAG: hypothetical protein ABUL60_23625 [Myxococcales bacterium]